MLPPIEYYIDAGSELSSKAKVVLDIVEQENTPLTVVCETNNDAVFVENYLRKRGVDARRLVNKIQLSEDKAEEFTKRLSEVSTLVIAKACIELVPIRKILVNYSIPVGSDEYEQRKLYCESMITVVAPKDVIVFNSLTKSLSAKPKELVVQPTEVKPVKALTSLVDKLAKIEVKKEELEEAASILDESCKTKLIAIALRTFKNDAEMPSICAEFGADLSNEYNKYRNESRGDDRRSEGRYDSRDSRRGGGDDRRRDSRDGGSRDDRRGRNDRNDRSDNRNDTREDNRGERREGHDNRPRRDGALTRIFIGQGSIEGLTPELFYDLAKEFAEVPLERISNPSFRDHYSFVDVSKEDADNIISNLNGIEYNGQVLPVELAMSMPNRGRNNNRRRDGGRDDRRGGYNNDRDNRQRY